MEQNIYILLNFTRDTQDYTPKKCTAYIAVRKKKSNHARTSLQDKKSCIMEHYPANCLIKN